MIISNFRTFMPSWPPEITKQMVATGGAPRSEAVDFIKIQLKNLIETNFGTNRNEMTLFFRQL